MGQQPLSRSRRITISVKEIGSLLSKAYFNSNYASYKLSLYILKTKQTKKFKRKERSESPIIIMKLTNYRTCASALPKDPPPVVYPTPFPLPPRPPPRAPRLIAVASNGAPTCPSSNVPQPPSRETGRYEDGKTEPADCHRYGKNGPSAEKPTMPLEKL